jgi:hypothetical protein
VRTSLHITEKLQCFLRMHTWQWVDRGNCAEDEICMKCVLPRDRRANHHWVVTEESRCTKRYTCRDCAETVLISGPHSFDDWRWADDPTCDSYFASHRRHHPDCAYLRTCQPSGKSERRRSMHTRNSARDIEADPDGDYHSWLAADVNNRRRRTSKSSAIRQPSDRLRTCRKNTLSAAMKNNTGGWLAIGSVVLESSRLKNNVDVDIDGRVMRGVGKAMRDSR